MEEWSPDEGKRQTNGHVDRQAGREQRESHEDREEDKGGTHREQWEEMQGERERGLE